MYLNETNHKWDQSGLNLECGACTTIKALPRSGRYNLPDVVLSLTREICDGFRAHFEDEVDAGGILRVHEGVEGGRVELFRRLGRVSEIVGSFFHTVLKVLQGREYLVLMLGFSDPLPDFGLRVLVAEPFAGCGKAQALTRSEVNRVRSLAPTVGRALVVDLKHSLSWWTPSSSSAALGSIGLRLLRSPGR